jgi:hypothetical protein
MERTNSVMRVVFGVNVLFLLLLGFSYPYLEPGTGSYVVAVLTFGLCVVMLAIVGLMTYFEWDVFDRI